MGGKSYASQKFVFVTLVVVGVILFLYKPSVDDSNDESNLGYILVGGSLLMNGCQAGVQEKMRAVARPSSLNLMFFLNAWSSPFLVVGVLFGGELNGFVAFCRDHPEVITQIALILAVGGCGQFFVCTMITNYGVVPCCLVLTIRKFFNVLFSVLYYGNTLTTRQWLATALIFTSLLADAALSARCPKRDKEDCECSNKVDDKASVGEDKSVLMSV